VAGPPAIAAGPAAPPEPDQFLPPSGPGQSIAAVLQAIDDSMPNKPGARVRLDLDAGPGTAPTTALRTTKVTAGGAPSRKAARLDAPRRPRKTARTAKTRQPVPHTRHRSLIRGIGRVPRKVLLLATCAVVAAGAGAGYVLLRPAPSHGIAVPGTLGSYVMQPSLATSTALPLKNRIVSAAAGKVKNVVAAAYQTGAAGAGGPSEVFVFIGGNLAGGESASSFISGMLAQLPGSFPTSAGSLGGSAACAPGSPGKPAECAWADNDTFGLLVSATMNAQALAAELRAMRQLVEHSIK
jgi:hypothetical protein